MSPPRRAATLTERYDQALRYARDQRLPADQPRPQPTPGHPRTSLCWSAISAGWPAAAPAQP